MRVVLCTSMYSAGFRQWTKKMTNPPEFELEFFIKILGGFMQLFGAHQTDAGSS